MKLASDLKHRDNLINFRIITESESLTFQPWNCQLLHPPLWGAHHLREWLASSLQSQVLACLL